MPCENGARKHSKTMAFRCTSEEYRLIADMTAWSGMSRQDYIMAKLTDTQIAVKLSVSVQKALRDSMAALTKESEPCSLLRRAERIFAAARGASDGVLPGARGAGRCACSRGAAYEDAPGCAGGA